MKKTALGVILIVLIVGLWLSGSHFIKYFKSTSLFKSAIKPILNDPRQKAKHYESIAMDKFRLPGNGRNLSGQRIV